MQLKTPKSFFINFLFINLPIHLKKEFIFLLILLKTLINSYKKNIYIYIYIYIFICLLIS